MATTTYKDKLKRLKKFGLNEDTWNLSMDTNLPSEIADNEEQVMSATLFYLSLNKMALDKKWLKNINEIIAMVYRIASTKGVHANELNRNRTVKT